jgi:hypothetical protein
MCRELAAFGPPVILPVLRSASAELETLDRALLGTNVKVAYSQLLVRNVKEIVDSIGPSARPTILECLLDPEPVVRSLAAALLGLTGNPGKEEVLQLERVFVQETDPLTLVAMGSVLLMFPSWPSPSTRKLATNVVAPWADRLEPEWRTAVNGGLSEEDGLVTAMLGNLHFLVFSQATLLARRNRD